ncbi:MAG: hypothetical protein V4659_08970 [Pseudomonadota bacterium]
MLAIVQLWPLVFGGADGAEASLQPRLVSAAQAAERPAKVAVPTPKRIAKVPMPSCYHRYERAFAACTAGNAGCQLRAGDHWDVCEATGFWPD